MSFSPRPLRVALLLMALRAVGAAWLVEQPNSSLAWYHPRLRSILRHFTKVGFVENEEIWFRGFHHMELGSTSSTGLVAKKYVSIHKQGQQNWENIEGLYAYDILWQFQTNFDSFLKGWLDRSPKCICGDLSLCIISLAIKILLGYWEWSGLDRSPKGIFGDVSLWTNSLEIQLEFSEIWVPQTKATVWSHQWQS